MQERERSWSKNLDLFILFNKFLKKKLLSKIENRVRSWPCGREFLEEKAGFRFPLPRIICLFFYFFIRVIVPDFKSIDLEPRELPLV